MVGLGFLYFNFVFSLGRIWDIYQEGHPHLAQLPQLSYLAIDETDRMIEKGHFEEMQKLLEVINNPESKNKGRQTFVFSATLSLVHDLPKHLSGKNLIHSSS